MRERDAVAPWVSSEDAGPGFSSASRSSPFRPRDHLESLILKHGYPTPVSLSSLRDLTATSSAYHPPSPPSRSFRSSRPHLRHTADLPLDAFESLSLSASSTRPIPIPRRASQYVDIEDLPVTPLTGRFDHDDYIEDWERASLSAKSRHLRSPRSSYRGREVRMRSDRSPFYSPVASPTMSPRRPSSPQPARKSQPAPTKPMPGFNLGSLPRFHPAVYQPPSTDDRDAVWQPPSPRQFRQTSYLSAGSRDSKWELFGGATQSPSAPRLDPLLSPGPVTPLALEANDYLSANSGSKSSSKPNRFSQDGTGYSTGYSTGPPADLIEQLIARENEKARQKNRKSTKGR
ncbi:hypothetical protein N7462_006596 [Penicillium macrosclerotiorum]|uniref:uncharacterized protein n=1 Tax=Penicillium macrosclerotiorum TaxID=303699 RepID=UPI002547B743|nr:uncharacterized protein N7462_006596 [Penicillium macrosclerotiorum]KAJ5683431.1 hypothetical protein N7462_006596 [Penicillium macrosclerotiorum]